MTHILPPPPFPRRWRRPVVLAAAVLAPVALAAGCARPGGPPVDSGDDGARLAARHCQSCHLLPAPAELDRATWQDPVLPRMARRLGLHDPTQLTEAEPLEPGPGGERVRDAGIFPQTPRLTLAEWGRIAAYYLDGAPDTLPRPSARPAVAAGLPGFRVRVPDFRIPGPMVTTVRVDTARRRILVGDASPDSATLTTLDARGRLLESRPLPSPASHVEAAGDSLVLLLMGKLHPSDAARGSLATLPAGRGAALAAPAWGVEGLQRPVHAAYAELSGDGVPDVVVSEFGNLTGRLAWYERRAGGAARRHLLSPQPGAIGSVVRDLDGDGLTDVLALFAQGDENVSLFRGRPGGGFRQERLARFPASLGSNAMDVADVDGDGRPDVVHSAGDLGDYEPRPKPYHGVRVLRNEGGWRLREAFFFPMHGASGVLARDFDGDGDVDIAAVAFYADYASGAPLSFVLLENQGGLRFRAHTFAEAERGRWLAMDAGDVDGDGDIDLVLGSFARLDAAGDRSGFAARWRAPDAPTVLILENTLRDTR